MGAGSAPNERSGKTGGNKAGADKQYLQSTNSSIVQSHRADQFNTCAAKGNTEQREIDQASKRKENEENVDNDDDLEILCRICYSPEDKPYVSPCKCKGTMGLVHMECLERWLVESGRSTCELCGVRYPTKRELCYTAGSSLFAWFLRSHKLSFVHYTYMRYLRTDVTIFVIITLILFVAAFFCVYGADYYEAAGNAYDWPAANKWTSLALFLILVCLSGGYYVWMFITVRYHFRMWYWWWQHTVTVKVIAEVIDVNTYLKRATSNSKLANINEVCERNEAPAQNKPTSNTESTKQKNSTIISTATHKEMQNEHQQISLNTGVNSNSIPITTTSKNSCCIWLEQDDPMIADSLTQNEDVNLHSNSGNLDNGTHRTKIAFHKKNKGNKVNPLFV